MKDLKLLLKALSEKPIAYHRVYSEITGGLTTGVMLSQLVYWDMTMGGEFYKTNEDFQSELGMSEWEFKQAKKKLIEKTLIETKRKGVPAKTFYNVNTDRVISLLLSWAETSQLDGMIPPNKISGNLPTITENTSKTNKDIQSILAKDVPTPKVKTDKPDDDVASLSDKNDSDSPGLPRVDNEFWQKYKPGGDYKPAPADVTSVEPSGHLDELASIRESKMHVAEEGVRGHGGRYKSKRARGER